MRAVNSLVDKFACRLFDLKLGTLVHMITVPVEQIEAETLKNIVEEFVTRDGTDYGETERSLVHKVDEIMAKIRTGKILVVYDEELESVNLMDADSLKAQHPEY